MSSSSKLWEPSQQAFQIDDFRRHINLKYQLNLTTYQELWQWSVDSYKEFWANVWEFCGVIASAPYQEIIEDKRMDLLPKWFKGARLNLAENLLRFRGPQAALIDNTENAHIATISYDQLYERVHAFADGLRRLGVQPGDRVVGYVPNTSDTVIAMLGATAVGAIWASASPDFGVTGILERFKQISPRVLVTVDRVLYNGQWHPMADKLKGVVAGLVSLEKVVVMEYGAKCGAPPADNAWISEIPKCQTWSSFAIPPTAPMRFEQLPFDHPVYILFSSGTTGKPKCIVHCAGGMILQHKKEMMLHGNMHSQDIFFYYTTVDWMDDVELACEEKENGLLILVGCTVVLYDGSPFKPSPNRLFDLVDQHKITVFGTSAKYIQSLQATGVKPGSTHSLDSMHTLLSTGSPLPPESFLWIYQSIKKNVLVGSITGGTDICSLFAGHNAALPVYKGEIQCRCLGMAVEGWDDEGKVVPNGAHGDLVCTKPFPCMPVYFWDDPNNEKYRAAYFSRYEGVWYHGDFVMVMPESLGVVMLGRSDGTLNPGGVRFGSAELYHVCNLAVGQKMGSDERVVLFCKMKDGCPFTETLVADIKAKIKAQLSPRHVPSVILAIGDIPYTLTGKKVEVAVKRIISGEKIIPSGAIANPSSLELYYNIPELKLDAKIKERL